MSPADRKQALRASLLARRRSLSLDDRLRASAALTGAVLASVSSARRVAAYGSVGVEPGTRPLLSALSARGVEVLLPVVSGASLDWAPASSELVPGPYGLVEPPGPRLGVASLRTVDVVIAPGLAVDRRGVRLGRGGGYYDRALSYVRPETPVAVLLYDGELVAEDLPDEPHDHPVTAVVTPVLGWLDLG